MRFLVSKLIKKRILKLKNQKVKQEADEINAFSTKRQIEELYRAFKNDNSCFKNGTTAKKCDPQKLIEYFADHFGLKKSLPTPKELIVAPAFDPPIICDSSRDINIDPPNEVEIIKILKKLKGGNLPMTSLQLF